MSSVLFFFTTRTTDISVRSFMKSSYIPNVQRAKQYKMVYIEMSLSYPVFSSWSLWVTVFIDIFWLIGVSPVANTETRIREQEDYFGKWSHETAMAWRGSEAEESRNRYTVRSQHCRHCGQLALTPAGNPWETGRNWCLRVIHPRGKGAEVFIHQSQHSLMGGSSPGDGRRLTAQVILAAAANQRKPSGEEMQVLAVEGQSSMYQGDKDGDNWSTHNICYTV